MSILDKITERLFKERLIKLQDDYFKSQGSDFYARVLEWVGKNPILMADNVEAYVNEGYLFNPTVYSLISFVSQKASTIPFSVYEVKNDKMLQLYKYASPDLPAYKKEMVKKKALVQLPDHELNQLFITPNAIQPWSEFIEQTVGFKMLTGNSYTDCLGPLNGNNKGIIKEMWTYPSQAITIVPGDRYKIVDHYEMIGDREIKIPAERMIHLKYWTPEYAGGRFLYGLSPIRAGRRVVSKSNAAFDSWVASFQNFGVRGILTPDPAFSNRAVDDLTEEQQRDIESRFAKKTGPRNAGKPLVSGIPLKWQQTGMSPVDLAIIESDMMDLRTLCNVFHVPSELFNDPANKVYATTKEAGSAVYTNAVIPALTSFRDGFNQKIYP